jgi:hypothetical protein
MTDEWIELIRDLVEGQTDILETLEPLVEDLESQPGRRAQAAAVAAKLQGHKPKLAAARKQIARFI